MVLDDQHREAVGGADAADQRSQLSLLGGVHAGGRFIEQQQLRPAGQGAGDLQAPPLPVGERGGGPIGQLGDAHALEKVPGLQAQLGLALFKGP